MAFLGTYWESGGIQRVIRFGKKIEFYFYSRSRVLFKISDDYKITNLSAVKSLKLNQIRVYYLNQHGTKRFTRVEPASPVEIIIYPPGSKCEALRLGVHLILLYFIRILVVGTEIIFLFCGCGCGCGCWCGWRTFFVFKSLDNNMIYSSYITMYIYKRNPCRTKVLWVLKFGEVGDPGT